MGNDFYLRDFTAPNSDEFSFMDVAGAPLNVEIVDAALTGDDKRPVNVFLKGYEQRPWKPGKNMLRVLYKLSTNGKASGLRGVKLQLYGDPDVTYGKEKVGGVRIYSASTIDKPINLPITARRGKRELYTVYPFEEKITRAQIENCATVDELRELWAYATPELKEAITARAEQLQQQEAKGGGK